MSNSCLPFPPKSSGKLAYTLRIWVKHKEKKFLTVEVVTQWNKFNNNCAVGFPGPFGHCIAFVWEVLIAPPLGDLLGSCPFLWFLISSACFCSDGIYNPGHNWLKDKNQFPTQIPQTRRCFAPLGGPAHFQSYVFNFFGGSFKTEISINWSLAQAHIEL